MQVAGNKPEQPSGLPPAQYYPNDNNTLENLSSPGTAGTEGSGGASGGGKKGTPVVDLVAGTSPEAIEIDDSSNGNECDDNGGDDSNADSCSGGGGGCGGGAGEDGVSGEGGGGGGGTLPEDPHERLKCLCCYDNFSNIINVPCGHMNTCAACVNSSENKIKPLEHGCIICKQRAKDIKQVDNLSCGPPEGRASCKGGFEGCTGKVDTLFLPCKCFTHCRNCSDVLAVCIPCRRKKVEYVAVYE